MAMCMRKCVCSSVHGLQCFILLLIVSHRISRKTKNEFNVKKQQQIDKPIKIKTIRIDQAKETKIERERQRRQCR